MEVATPEGKQAGMDGSQSPETGTPRYTLFHPRDVLTLWAPTGLFKFALLLYF